MENLKKHKVFDHPILGMFLSIFLTYLFIVLALGTVKACFGNAEFSDVTSSVVMIILSVICLLFHRFWFRKELNNFFNIKGLKRAFIMGWSIIIATVITEILDIYSGNPIANPMIAIVLGLSPGISEEIAWRIIPISIAMRNKDKKGVVMSAYLLPSIAFGLIHFFNIFAGADILATIVQVAYAIGLGLIFAAIYIRTGNIWCSILLHSLVDIIAFLSEDVQKSNGVLTQSSQLSEYWLLAIFTILFFINAFLIFRKDKRTEISNVWDKIWG